MPNQASVVRGNDRLLFPLQPRQDESYLGFTTRLASWNCFENRRDMLRTLGFENLGRRDIDQAAGDTGAIASRMGISHEVLGRLSYRDCEPEFRSELVYSIRRLSPRALRDAPLHHRRGWMFDRLPYCPASWETLIDKCPGCAGRLGWSLITELHVCEHCGFDLRKASGKTIPPADRRRLRFFAELAEATSPPTMYCDAPLPGALVGEPSILLYRLTDNLGRLIARKEAREVFSKLSRITQAKYLAKGVAMIEEYPYSFDALALDGNKPLPQRLRQMRLGMLANAECARVFDRLLSDWEPCRHGLKRLKRERELSDCLTVREAAQETGLENRTIRHLVEVGLLVPLDSRGVARRYDWLSKDDVRVLVGDLANRMSVREFSRAHQVPNGGVLQLVARGLLDLNISPYVAALHDALQLDRSKAMHLIGRLKRRLRFPPRDCETLTLEETFHGIGNQPKPWGAMLSAALNGDLEIYWSHEDSEHLHLGTLRIGKADAMDIVARRRPELLESPPAADERLRQRHFSRGEAEAYLNCFPRDLGWLLCHGHLDAEMPTEEVEALGRSLISSREITWRWRVSPGMRDALATEHGIPRSLGPFWPRAAVEAHLAHLARPLQSPNVGRGSGR